MSDNESYKLAEEYVGGEINLTASDEPEERYITIDDMQECDCIPVGVTDSLGRLWLVEDMEWRNTGPHVSYEHSD